MSLPTTTVTVKSQCNVTVFLAVINDVVNISVSREGSEPAVRAFFEQRQGKDRLELDDLVQVF